MEKETIDKGGVGVEDSLCRCCCWAQWRLYHSTAFLILDWSRQFHSRPAIKYNILIIFVVFNTADWIYLYWKSISFCYCWARRFVQSKIQETMLFLCSCSDQYQQSQNIYRRKLYTTVWIGKLWIIFGRWAELCSTMGRRGLSRWSEHTISVPSSCGLVKYMSWWQERSTLHLRHLHRINKGSSVLKMIYWTPAWCNGWGCYLYVYQCTWSLIFRSHGSTVSNTARRTWKEKWMLPFWNLCYKMKP